jgi:transcriptional regulator with XRE-family HTH domain
VITAGNWEEVGRSVESLRNERGWTQTDLSMRSGVSLATIRNTEHAIGSRSRRTLEDMSRALGRPRDYLSEILEGPHPAGNAEAIEPGPQAFLDLLDDMLVTRLRELVVTHLNQVERQLHGLREDHQISP